jgi:hypothetical protein
MNAGLPGTGVGGVFYVLLVVLMPFRALALRALGRPPERGAWRVILFQSGLVAGILGALYLEALAIEWVFIQASMHDFYWLKTLGVSPQLAGALAPAITVFPFAILGFLLAMIRVLRVIFPLRVPAPAAPTLVRLPVTTSPAE